MRQENLRRISENEWMNAAENARTGALCRVCRPTAGFDACVFTCRAEDFLSDETYPLRYTDSTGVVLVPFYYPGAKRIKIDDLAADPAFSSCVFGDWEWYDDSRSPKFDTNLITVRCTECERRIVIDGVHRIVWIAKFNRDARLTVYELSGLKWPKCMPDMNRVCGCDNRPSYEQCNSRFRRPQQRCKPFDIDGMYDELERGLGLR